MKNARILALFLALALVLGCGAFAYGDSVDVTFSNGYTLTDLPYYNGYYTGTGVPLLVAYPGYPYIKACINNGDDLWVLAVLPLPV